MRAEYDRLKTEGARLARERQDLDVQECQARDQHTQLREAIARGAKHMEDKEVALEGIVEARRGEEQTPGLDAEHAFRADFVGRLQENLAQLEDQLKELNRNLLRRPFHG